MSLKWELLHRQAVSIAAFATIPKLAITLHSLSQEIQGRELGLGFEYVM